MNCLSRVWSEKYAYGAKLKLSRRSLGDVKALFLCRFSLLPWHYTTTPKLALDNLTLKADTTPDDLTLKTYSVRLLPTL
jgi:hypothetical protein